MSSVRRIIWFGAAIATLALASGAVAVTQPSIDPTSLELTGRLGGSATGSIRLTAPDEETEVILRATELKLESADGTTDVLAASAVAFGDSTPTLKGGLKTDVTVTVTGFRYVGVYVGKIMVEYAAVPPKPEGSPTPSQAPYSFAPADAEIALRVTVIADPTIALASSSAIKIAKTKCDWIECALVKLWVSDAETVDTTNIDLRNNSQVAGQVSVRNVSIVDRETATSLASPAVVVHPPAQPIPAGGLDSIDLSIDRGALDTGEYDGTIVLSTGGVPGQTVIPFEVNLRERPGILILVLVAGWFLVKIASWFRDQDRAATATADGKKQLAALRSKHPAEIHRIEGRLRDLEQKARWTPEDQGNANLLATDLGTLDVVRRMELRIGSDPRFDETRDGIAEVRRLIEEERKTNEAIAQANDTVEILAREATEAKASASELTESKRSEQLILPNSLGDLFGLKAAPVTISIEVPAFVLTVGWAVVRIGALVLLAILSLKVAYADTAGFNGATLDDFVTLLGLGSAGDVVSRTLTNVLNKDKA